MAIIQISKIQQRSGNLVDLPQLDEAQFGWASDAKRLFIGKTDPNENIEVLTSYSTISFSQINGSDGGNFNISNAQNGQIITYVESTNTWENWPSTDILTANANFKIDLGNVENIIITGNANPGFVLETDGLGNLSWTPKGVVVSEIANVTQANPGVVTTVDNHYLVEGAAVTITNVSGMTELNGNVYYANVLTSNTFILCAAVGPSSPVDTSGYSAYTGNGQIVSTVGGSVSVPGGSNLSIQFNNSSYLDGSPYFTITTTGNLTHSGPQFVVGNVYANSGNVVANVLTGNILTVSGNANIGNIGTGGLITATGNIRGGNLITTGTLSVTGNANTGNIGTTLITATGNITGANLITGGVLNVTGNSNVGNLGTTGLITATGNIGAGNLNTSGILSVAGNSNLSNINITGNIIPTANITYDLGSASNAFRDLYLSGTSIKIGAQTITSNASGVTLSNTAFANSLSIVGNANIGNIGATAGIFSTVQGTLTTTAQPNITSTGTLSSLSVSGNANIGNIGTGGLITATGNIRGGNLVTGGLISVTGNANIGNIGTALITASGNITGANLITSGVISVTGNANIGNIGTALITASGNITGANLITGGQVSATGNITAPWFIGNVQGNITGNLNVTGSNTQVLFNDNGNANATSGFTFNKTTNAVVIGNTISAVGNITGGNLITAGIISATGNANVGNIGATLHVGNLSGTGNSNVGNLGATGIFATTLSSSGNANVGNLGTGGLITATGNIQGGNLVTGGQVSASGNASVLGIKTDNYYYANGVSISFSGTYSNSNVAAYLPTYTGNITAGNISATGNITAGNFIGSGAGSPTINSSTTLTISATTGVTLSNVTLLSTGSNVTAGSITGNWSLTSGSRLNATYADLAEYYEADHTYEPGTVLEFGGSKEVTLAQDETNKVAGVVSTNPAYAMNTKCKGIAVPIALQGRVPCKVRGKVQKGDMMISAGEGFARSEMEPKFGSVIGKSLVDFDGIEGVIEIAVGRL